MAEGSISQEEYEQIVQVAFAVAAEQLENAEVERENKELEEAGAGAKVEVNSNGAGPAVEWVPDSRAPNCMRCEASFTMLNRKYVTHRIQRAICLKNDIYSRKVV